MGYSPLMWGKEAWQFIHFVAMSYPDAPTEIDKKNYLDFFSSLQYVLPCPTCAYNFKKKMEVHPPNLTNRKALFNWTVDVHNSVNEENGKDILTYEEAEYELFSQKFVIKYTPIAKSIIFSGVSIICLLFLAKLISNKLNANQSIRS